MQAIGTISSQRARKIGQQQLQRELEDAGQRRDGADLDVRRRAGQRARVRKAVQQRHEHLHPALAPQFLVGVVGHAAVVGQAVGHPRAEQALDAGDEHDRDHEVDQVPDHASASARSSPGGVNCSRLVGDRAVLVLDERQARVADQTVGAKRSGQAQRDQRRRDELRNLQAGTW